MFDTYVNQQCDLLDLLFVLGVHQSNLNHRCIFSFQIFSARKHFFSRKLQFSEYVILFVPNVFKHVDNIQSESVPYV